MSLIVVGSPRIRSIVVAAAALLCLAGAQSASAAVVARGSAEQVQVTGATAGAKLALKAPGGKTVASLPATSLGGAVFRDVKPGAYTLSGQKVTVFSTKSAPPSTKGYDQKIPDSGYGYLTTRDGTKLAINVHRPAGVTGSTPSPTLIEYAGYAYAREPNGASSIAQVATLLGFTVVDVNMRGTGCSGGAFDYFEPLQSLDGYDVIETVARQPWAKFHKVGMMGISYGGISQLFTASTRPPSLSAIAPLSVLDDSATTLYPGGILNTGFALNWSKERDHDAMPASATGGQPYALAKIKDGDATCKANQTLHASAVNLVGKVKQNEYYVPKVADPVAPRTFVDKIDVPTYVACQWTDEQTGGHCPTLAADFTGTKKKWFTFTNGTHIDSLDPESFNRWFDFLKLYVAREAPRLDPAAKAAAPVLFKAFTGVDGVTLPDDPIQAEPDYASALAAFEKLPPVRILFDNGAGGVKPGVPGPGFEQSFARWPLPGTRARSFYLGAKGTLSATPPTTAAQDTFTWTRKGVGPTNFTGDTGAGDLWTELPNYHWLQRPAGTSLSFATPELSADTVIVGGGALQLYVKSPSPSADLQVTVSELRPDGKEVFVQNGYLRGNGRALDARRSTLLEPVPSLTRAASAPWRKGAFTPITIPLYYQGHAYRKGSRIRIVVSAPGGAQPVWSFGASKPAGDTKVTLAYSAADPARLILPEVPGITIPTPLPPCPGLRGEPCRDIGASS